ncbi:permease-like cell division protein FtsX [Noviherbaspirillum massiliense]|uniref:permease-like cell division protein FtsX n=1 Tax=Noviherbaspirillum massiliense TaxID=1465823 RepID=UPI0002FBAE59|nr:permease-like cell division protein FtsX [Noviherbaspirillum massiliense]
MKPWIRQHLYALAEACKHLLRHPGSFLLNMLVVSVALALPFAGLTMLENVRPVSERLAVEPEISVFLKLDTPRETALALATQIDRTVGTGTAKLEFLPREQALNKLRDKAGLADALAALGDNPLPDAYVVRLPGFQDAVHAAEVEAVANRLRTLPGVEQVQVDSAWVKRLAALVRVLRVVLLFMAGTLAVVVVAVVFNTIRLQVMTQREEIEACRMFGATNAFIYRPFCYTGALLGLFAGAAALVMVGVALYPLNAAIFDFARMYGSEFRLSALNFSSILILLAISAALGLSGAFFSVRRHLTRP